MSYLLLTKPAFHTYEIKKSLFHAAAYPIASRTEAMDALAIEKTSYPDARHHCWAYLLGAPQHPTNQGYNDDGEPSGTAGKPMLNVLSHGDCGDVMVIISRYFGGIKLGAGGLVRAYSHASKLVFENVITTPFIKRTTYLITCRFDQEPWLRQQAQKYNLQLHDVTYSLTVQMHVSIPVDCESVFLDLCRNQQIPFTQP